MEDKTRRIKKTPEYDIIQWQYTGIDGKNHWCTFRFWKDGSDLVEVKADEAFAKSNGYNTVEDYFKDACNCDAIMQIVGHLPEWLRIDGNGMVSYWCKPWQLNN